MWKLTERFPRGSAALGDVWAVALAALGVYAREAAGQFLGRQWACTFEVFHAALPGWTNVAETWLQTRYGATGFQWLPTHTPRWQTVMFDRDWRSEFGSAFVGESDGENA